MSDTQREHRALDAAGPGCIPRRVPRPRARYPHDLVADAGSVLSHTAIVAREYGLPAVVATSNGTSTLVDGEEVVVDGNHGTVERVAPQPTSSGQHSNLSVN